jgi:serine/threonine-protein kinase
LRPELAVREPVVARFRSEAQTLARLSHPNIATLHTLLENQDSLFMVMEYVEGRTLSSLIRAAGRLDLDATFDIFQQALDGIGHAHEVGVIHRDIKGSNAMVDSRGLVKIMDFGIARVTGSDRMTRHGNLVGTPEFMSPEQVQGKEASVQSDIYSLGVLLYQMLTGRVPFQMKGDFDLMQAQVQKVPPPPRSLVPEIPEEIEEVILCALEKDPENRYHSTRAFQAALESAGVPPRAAPNTAHWLADLGGANGEEPEDPTLQTDASDSSSVGPTKLILEEDAEDEADEERPATRSSHRWSRIAAGVVLVGLALGANVLKTTGPPTSLTAEEASSSVFPPRGKPLRGPAIPLEQEDPTHIDLPPFPGLEPSARAADAPAGESDPGANGQSHAEPKKEGRSSEETPGWVIRRE